MSKRDNDMVVHQSDRRIPSIVESEEVIRRDAPAALITLSQHGAMDLADMLGLSTTKEN